MANAAATIAPQASPQLLRLMISQNAGALRRLSTAPPEGWESPAGRDQLALMQALQGQTLALSERLDAWLRNPPPGRPRRSWRDLAPTSR